jgi:hypothetical protein
MSRSGASYAIAAVALAGAVGLAAACKSTTSNNCGNGRTPPSLIGTYSMLSYTIGTATFSVPPASGELRFYATTYGLDAIIPKPPPDSTQFISDSGNYQIIGASCILESSVDSASNSFSGSFSFVADSTLRLTGTASGKVAASLWKLKP